MGYGALVEDFLIDASWTPNGVLQDWNGLVKHLRDDYFQGHCAPVSDGWLFGYTPFSGGQFAVPQGELARGLEEYMQDAGYAARGGLHGGA